MPSYASTRTADVAPPSAEDIAAHEARLAEERQRCAQECREREAAAEKAEALLRAHLTTEQQADLDAHQHFFLHVGEKIYRIDRGRTGNVKLIDTATGRIKTRYCAHPDLPVPDADTMLAQKLMLEADEAAFLRIANAR